MQALQVKLATDPVVITLWAAAHIAAAFTVGSVAWPLLVKGVLLAVIAYSFIMGWPRVTLGSDKAIVGVYCREGQWTLQRRNGDCAVADLCASYVSPHRVALQFADGRYRRTVVSVSPFNSDGETLRRLRVMLRR